MDTTKQQYDKAVQSCKEIFLKKTRDYGTSWRVHDVKEAVEAIRLVDIYQKKETPGF